MNPINGKSIFLIALFVLGICPAFSQLNWAPLGAKWYYTDYIPGFGPNPIEYLTLEVIDDSISGDILLSKLEIIRHNTSGNIYVGYEYTYAKDSIVYYWKNDTSYVMYDFTKKIGGTHNIYGKSRYNNECNSSFIGSVIIDSIGLEKINGIDARYYYGSKTDTSTWEYEGMISSIYGNKNFLFAREIFCGVADVASFAGPLRCYEDSRVGQIKYSEYECDTIIIYGTDEIESINSLVKVYPNPAQKELNIEIASELINYSEFIVKIIDSEGKTSLENIISDPCTTTDVSSLSAGLYFVKVQSLDARISIVHNVLLLQ